MPKFEKKLIRWVRGAVAPSHGPTESAKARFLAAFDARYPARPSRHFSLAVRFAVGIVAIFGIMAGASVYADTQNVSADNVLYPLKRLGESVQLVLATPQEKPQLQASFAVRRAAEITDLQAREPSSTMITALSGDLDSDVDASIKDVQQSDLQDGKLNNFCQTLFPAVASSSVGVNRSGRIRAIVDFKNECNRNASTTAGVGTSTMFVFPLPGDASDAASSSASVSSMIQRGRGGKNGHGDSNGQGGVGDNGPFHAEGAGVGSSTMFHGSSDLPGFGIGGPFHSFGHHSPASSTP